MHRVKEKYVLIAIFFFFNSYLDRCLAKQVYVTLVEHAFVFGCMSGSVP